jgi:hypothetical protein
MVCEPAKFFHSLNQFRRWWFAAEARRFWVEVPGWRHWTGAFILATLSNSPAGNADAFIMNKKDIAETLRTEVGALEDLIKKLKSRSDRLKKMLFELEEEIAGPAAQKEIKMLGADSKFRKMVDRVFGETPKPPKR